MMPLRFGTFEFDAATLELRRDGRLVKLEPQPARALARLLDTPDVERLVAEAGTGASLAELVDHVESSVRRDGGAALSDDLAILALRIAP